MRKLILVVLLLAGCTSTQSRHVVESAPLEREGAPEVAGRVLDDFNAPDAGDAWKLYTVAGSLNPLVHQPVDGALKLTSDSSAGLLWRPLGFDPREEPLLSWRWKVSRTFDTSTPLSPEFDNFPARLLVGFDSGWSNAGPAAVSWRRKVERVTGVTPPARALCYTFGGHLPKNEGVDAAFGEGRIVVINLRTTHSTPGQWYGEVRDIAADYRAIFGEPAPRVMAIGLGCDSHRLETEVSAFFDDLVIYPPEARAQFRARLGDPPGRRTPPLVWIIYGLCAVVASGSIGAWFWMHRRTS